MCGIYEQVHEVTYIANIHLYLVNERSHLQSSLSGRLHPSAGYAATVGNIYGTLLLDKTLSAVVTFSEHIRCPKIHFFRGYFNFVKCKKSLGAKSGE
jgi:hypothetical protein